MDGWPLGKAFFRRPRCMRQVFSEMEVAERFAISLAQLGIEAKAVVCERCRLIHVIEQQSHGTSKKPNGAIRAG